MPASIDSPKVQEVLARLHARAEKEDPEAQQRVREREAEVGTRLGPPQRYELYADAPLAITPEVGRFYYLLATARGARNVIEFGASHGISTIYLAATLHDLGAGSLITTELLPNKAAWANQNVADAGLDDFVEVRCGDALETLQKLPSEVDLLVLDGRNDQYVPVLDLVKDALVPQGVVLADLGKSDPDLQDYQRYVRGVPNFVSMTLPLDAGIELTVKQR